VHEIGLAESILHAVEQRAAGRGVERVKVRVGTLHRVAAPAMDQAFELVAAGTVAAGAAVDLVVIPVHVRCETCGGEADSAEMVAACPSCGALEPTLTGGDELTLESIQVRPGVEGAD
jgi:hydrogenase nickel incorporation protein HypA/HybF